MVCVHLGLQFNHARASLSSTEKQYAGAEDCC